MIPGNPAFSRIGATATTIDVTGTMTQGPNIGASNATLTGTMSETQSNIFCAYLNNVTFNGLISGTTANVTLYLSDEGTQIGQIANATVTPDGSSLTTAEGDGTFLADTLSASCPSRTGSITLTFLPAGSQVPGS